MPWEEVAGRFKSSVKVPQRDMPVFGATSRAPHPRGGAQRRPTSPWPHCEIRFRVSLPTLCPAPNVIGETTHFSMLRTIPLGRQYCDLNNLVRPLQPESSSRLTRGNLRLDQPQSPTLALFPSEEPPWRSRIHCHLVRHVPAPVMSCTLRFYERTIRQRVM